MASPPPGALTLVFRYRVHERELQLAKGPAGPPLKLWAKLCAKAWEGLMPKKVKLAAMGQEAFDLATEEDAARAWRIANVSGQRPA